MTAQMTMDDIRRSEPPCKCRFRRRDMYSGMVVEDGLVVLGTCIYFGGTCYDRQCRDCTLDPRIREGRL